MVLLTDPGSRKNDVLRKNRNPERQYIFDKVVFILWDNIPGVG